MTEPWTNRSIEETFGHLVGIGDLSSTLNSTLKTTQAFIPIDITAAKGVPRDLIERVNGDTDPCQRIRWPAGMVFRAKLPSVTWPSDLDAGANVVVHVLLQRSGSTDDCDIDVLAFENTTGTYAADTEMGGKTAALTTTTMVEKTVTLAHANITGHPGILTLALLPDAHTSDDIYLYATWLEYTRALLSS